ncbi:MAG: thiolase, partial [Pseudolabrys sp.]
MKLDAAIVGIGNSRFGRGLPDSQLRLAATAFKNAIVDAGIERHDVDGLSIHLGSPIGVDYDRVAEAFGLE